jgi:hypothetical protein
MELEHGAIFLCSEAYSYSDDHKFTIDQSTISVSFLPFLNLGWDALDGFSFLITHNAYAAQHSNLRTRYHHHVVWHRRRYDSQIQYCNYNHNKSFVHSHHFASLLLITHRTDGMNASHASTTETPVPTIFRPLPPAATMPPSCISTAISHQPHHNLDAKPTQITTRRFSTRGNRGATAPSNRVYSVCVPHY